ncbi:MAG: type I polyketide synthase, partial [Burkholderiaceae bacterium]
WGQIQAGVGQLWARGVAIDWGGYEAGRARKRVPTPTYPFQRKRFWVEPVPKGKDVLIADSSKGAETLIGQRLRLPGSAELRFETRFTPSSPPYVPDHRIFGTLVVAGASHVSMFLQATREAFNQTQLDLKELFFLNPFVLADQDARNAQVVFRPDNQGDYSFELLSSPANVADSSDIEWTKHAEGRAIVGEPKATTEAPQWEHSVEAVKRRCPTLVSGEDFYRDEWVQGDDAGPAFRWFEELWRGEGEALARLQAPPLEDDLDAYAMHPGLIEACFQVMRGGYVFESQAMLADGGDIYVPFRIERCQFFGRDSLEGLWCYGHIVPGATRERVVGNLTLIDAKGELVAQIDGFEVRRLPRASLLRSLNLDGSAWLYEMGYVQPKADQPAVIVGEAPSGRWLISADQSGLGAWIGEQMLVEGRSVSVVSFTADTASCQQAIETALSKGEAIAGIVYLANLNGSSNPPDELLTLMQVLSHQTNLADNCSLSIVTAGAQATGADKCVDPWSSAVWGLARVFALEVPGIQCRCIDLPGDHELTASRDVLLRQVSQAFTDSHICIRDGHALVGRLRRKTVSPEQAEPHVPRSDAAYLISGGLRGLGLEVAKQFASQGAGELILLGRREPDAAAMSVINDLETSGTSVVVWPVDVADSQALAGFVKARESGAKPLRGIVHAAGVIDDGLISGQSVARLHAVMAPKVQGSLNLAALADQCDVDFFLMFSSATSVLGAGGQATYAVANAFIDGLALQRSLQGRRGHAVNWGPWAEVGMASRLSGRDVRRLQEAGIDRLGLNHGMEILGRLLSVRSGQTAVLPIAWSQYLQVSGHEVLEPLLSDLASRQPATQKRGTSKQKALDLEVLAGKAQPERLEALATYVRATVAELLGLDDPNEIDDQQGFVEIGLDSLMGVELRGRLQTQLETKLATTFAFDFPNVSAAAEHLEQKLHPAEPSSVSPSSPAVAEPVALSEVSASSTDSVEDELMRLEARLLQTDKSSSRGSE